MNQDPLKNSMQDMQANIIKQLSEQMQELRTDFRAGIESNNQKIDSFTQAVREVEQRMTKVEQEIENVNQEKK